MNIDAPSDEDLKKLRNQVATYPTDLSLRFQLGAGLFDRKDYEAAIPELHKAMNNPHFRLAAMRRLIEACEACGKSDLAARLRAMFARESGNDSDAGSAPVPVPTRPIRPLDSSRAKKRPNEDSAV